MITLTQFVAKYKGKKIDYDHAFGAQCVDLIKQYTHDCFGTADWTTGNGCATGIYINFPAALRGKFDKVANNPKDPNQLPAVGSIMIYGPTPGNKCGHTAVVVSRDKKSHQIFEQNANPIGSPCHLRNRDYTNVMGWLAPKGVNVDEIKRLMGHITTLEATVKDRERQAAAKDNQIKLLTDQVNGLAKTIQDVQKANADLQNVIKSKDETLSGKLAQITDQSNKIEELTKQLDEIKNKPPATNLYQAIIDFFKRK